MRVFSWFKTSNLFHTMCVKHIIPIWRVKHVVWNNSMGWKIVSNHEMKQLNCIKPNISFVAYHEIVLFMVWNKTFSKQLLVWNHWQADKLMVSNHKTCCSYGMKPWEWRLGHGLKQMHGLIPWVAISFMVSNN